MSLLDWEPGTNELFCFVSYFFHHWENHKHSTEAEAFPAQQRRKVSLEGNMLMALQLHADGSAPPPGYWAPCGEISKLLPREQRTQGLEDNQPSLTMWAALQEPLGSSQPRKTAGESDCGREVRRNI